MEDVRYHGRLIPRKKSIIQDHYALRLGRLNPLVKRTSNCAVPYHEVINDQLQKGIIERVAFRNETNETKFVHRRRYEPETQAEYQRCNDTGQSERLMGGVPDPGS